MGDYGPKTAAYFDDLRARAGGDPRVLTHIDRDERVELVRAMLDEIPPCPPWCTVGSGHEYDCTDGAHLIIDGTTAPYLTDDPVALIRYHCSDGTEYGAYVEQEERNESGTVTLGEIRLAMSEYDLPYTTADNRADARARAAAMREQADRIDLAADMLDAIRSAS